MGANLIDAGGLRIEIKIFYIFYNLLVSASRTTTTKAG